MRPLPRGLTERHRGNRLAPAGGDRVRRGAIVAQRKFDESVAVDNGDGDVVAVGPAAGERAPSAIASAISSDSAFSLSTRQVSHPPPPRSAAEAGTDKAATDRAAANPRAAVIARDIGIILGRDSIWLASPIPAASGSADGM
jgi:hypothetical protein